MTPKLDIPISYVLISKQLDFRRTLDTLSAISPEITDLPYGKVLAEDITRESLFVSNAEEYPALLVLAEKEPEITIPDLFEAIYAAQPILVLHNYPKERYTEITFMHRALLTQPQVLARKGNLMHNALLADKNNLAAQINTRIYPGKPSGQQFSFFTRTQHAFIPNAH